jgi:hypothetical protein
MKDIVMSNSTVMFLVMSSQGYGSDYSTRPERVFDSERSADTFAREMNESLAELRGMRRAIDAFMIQWEKDNPAPSDYADHTDYYACRAAYGESLAKIVGMQEACEQAKSSVYEFDDTTFYVVQVPTGFPKVDAEGGFRTYIGSDK